MDTEWDPVCEMPQENAAPAEVREILTSAKTIAVVGLSGNPERDSHLVAAYLQRAGYRIVPVNPGITEVLGEHAFPSLREVPVPVDIVDIFRKPDAIPGIVEEAIAIGAKAVWMQDGLADNGAAAKARAAGLRVVMSKCLMREHRRMGTGPGAVGVQAGP